ncbi:MAG: TIGR03032 family protein [Lysobacteraceae bacterium]
MSPLCRCGPSPPRYRPSATPKNALRIPFLAKAFPEARFVHLLREPFANTSSILEAWRSGNFITYPKLPDWKGGPWSLLLIPGWRELAGQSLAEVAVAQYEAANNAIIDALSELPRERWTALDYADLVAQPFETMDRLGEALGVHWDRPPPLSLPQSATTLTAPKSDKWRANAELLAPFAERFAAMRERITKATGIALADLSELAKQGRPVEAEPTATPVTDGAGPAKPAVSTSPVRAAPPPAQTVSPEVLRQLASTHSASFAEVLRRGGCSLAISTYQAGKLVLARMENDRVNTAFKTLPKPMGIAVDSGRMAVGTAQDVLFLQQSQAPAPAAGQLPSDARFLPRGSHVTGNIDIHEMAWVGDELWIVNTRFCCLATLAPDASFVPHWKPPFLTALAPEDRCHLNGLAVRDGVVRYVTMLGETDTQGGWRENKASGGLLYDVVEERVICRGLSMPHSPRWYDGKLYVLESGNGGLCEIDPETGAKDTLIELPGFTRGMDFLGPLAFIGLSQVRESAVFAKLPLTERLDERNCGVWVVHLGRRELIGFLRFEEAVQEIFSVNVLPGLRHPDLHVPGEPLLADAFVLPDAAMATVPAALRTHNAA